MRKSRQQARFIHRRGRDFPTVNRYNRHTLAVALEQLLIIVDKHALEVKAD
jgi:hypothetical protein